jgi:hypothetical protein
VLGFDPISEAIFVDVYTSADAHHSVSFRQAIAIRVEYPPAE